MILSHLSLRSMTRSWNTAWFMFLHICIRMNQSPNHSFSITTQNVKKIAWNFKKFCQINCSQKYFFKLSYPKRCPHDCWTWLGPRKQHSGSTYNRRKKRLIEGNAKCRHLKNLTCKMTLQKRLSVYFPSPTPLHTVRNTYSPREGGSGESWTIENVNNFSDPKNGRPCDHAVSTITVRPRQPVCRVQLNSKSKDDKTYEPSVFARIHLFFKGTSQMQCQDLRWYIHGRIRRSCMISPVRCA